MHRRPILLLASALFLAACSPRLPPPPERTPVPPSSRPISEHAGEVERLQCVQVGPVNGIAFSPDGQLVAVAADGMVRVYDVRSLAEVLAVEDPSGLSPGNQTLCVAFAPDGQTLAGGSMDHAVWLWGLGDEAPQHILRSEERALVVAVGFTADGQSVASVSTDMTLRLWRVSDGKLLRAKGKFQREPQMSSQVIEPWVALSPDGSMLAWGMNHWLIGAWVRVYRVADGKLLRAFRQGGWPGPVAFSSDGSLLAAVSSGNVAVWRLADGRVLFAKPWYAESVALSPDGGTLALGRSEGMVNLLRIADGELLATLESGHEGVVEQVAFSPDGGLLVSGEHEGTLCFWGVQP